MRRTSSSLGSVLVVTLLAVGTAIPMSAAADTVDGWISGSVFDASDGVPLEGVCIDVYDADFNKVAFGVTGTFGAYDVGPLPTGSYKLAYSDDVNRTEASCNDDYIAEWFSDATDFASADVVGVTSPGVTHVDAFLARGATISGTVTAEGSGDPIPNVCVEVYDAEQHVLVGFDETHHADGHYAAGGLPTGSYRVRFWDCVNTFFAAEWYDDDSDFASAIPVAATAPHETPDIDATLVQGGTISGTVSAEGTGEPLEGVLVEVYDLDFHLLATGQTGPDGGYNTTGGLPTGSHKVFFRDGNEWYDDEPDFESADPVAVSGPHDTPNIDATLDLSGPEVGVEVDVPLVAVDEGSVASNAGTISGEGPFHLSASVGIVTDNRDGTWSWSYTPDDGPDDTQTVTITVDDARGIAGSATFDLVVANAAPTVGDISGPAGPVAVGTEVDLEASFSDPGLDDTHAVAWDWGDGTDSAGHIDQTAGTVASSHTYTAAGVYTVTVTVTDDDGAAGQSAFEFVVVYDPDGGFVTGQGWIDSPEGAYTADPTLGGKANFGFVSKYRRGASTPTGNTTFRFGVASLNFRSSNYEWLVIAGAKAQFKGSGTMNGTGDYGFLLTAVDGEADGGGGEDRFRIKLWDMTTDEVVYDNLVGGNDTTTLERGNIVIHSGR